MGDSMACQRQALIRCNGSKPDFLFAHDLFRKPDSTFRNHASGSGSPGCEIELTQAPKGSTTRDYFDMARLRRRNAEFNWHREGFGAESPTGCVQFQEFMQRQQRFRKIKSL
jgi:hypothetical protein